MLNNVAKIGPSLSIHDNQHCSFADGRSVAKIYVQYKVLAGCRCQIYNIIQNADQSAVVLLDLYITVILIIKLDLDAWNFTTVLFTTCAAKRRAY